jgi:hypothetical protein
MRFAEPVRGSGADLEALNRLVASGEISLAPDDDEAAEGDETETPDSDSPLAPRPSPPTWNEGAEWGSSFDPTLNDSEQPGESEQPSDRDAPPSDSEEEEP